MHRTARLAALALLVALLAAVPALAHELEKAKDWNDPDKDAVHQAIARHLDGLNQRDVDQMLAPLAEDANIEAQVGRLPKVLTKAEFAAFARDEMDTWKRHLVTYHELEVEEIAIRGDTATASVQVRLRSREGIVFQDQSYVLERRDGTWRIVERRLA